MGDPVGVTRIAYTNQKRWVPQQCEMCGADYECFVEAFASADDTVLPASDDELKEGALLNLDAALLQKAEGLPCPKCGAYPQGHADRVKRLAGRFIVWGLFAVLFIAAVSLIAALAPKAPVWIALIVMALTYIAARIAGGRLAEVFDPNRDLPRNLQCAQGHAARGALRIKSA